MPGRRKKDRKHSISIFKYYKNDNNINSSSSNSNNKKEKASCQ